MMSSPRSDFSANGQTVAPGERLLAKMAIAFVDCFPLGLREMRALLASDGCPIDCDELKDIVRYYQARGARAPFHIVRFGGMEIAVAPSQVRLTAQIGAAAIRMVQHWGIASVCALTDRAQVVSGGHVPSEFVRKILAALPATRWLDGSTKEWFSFADRGSRLAEAVDKILALGRLVSLVDVRAALARTSASVTDAPPSVLERYLMEVAGCLLEDDHLKPPALGMTAALSRPEAVLVGILDASGGRLDPSTLRRRAAQADLANATLTRLLRFSPLVTRNERDEVQLLGAVAAPQASDASAAA